MLGSLTSVSCDPSTNATTEAPAPASGPAIETSNIASLFFGGSLNCVTTLVTPVIIEGTKVGNVIDV